jgi:hypothetical protein
LENSLSRLNYSDSKLLCLCLLYPFTFLSVEFYFAIYGRHHMSSDLKLNILLNDFRFLHILLINVDTLLILTCSSWFIVIITSFIWWTWNTINIFSFNTLHHKVSCPFQGT